jgi:putative acetyltransferase
MSLLVREGGLDDPRVIALLQQHVSRARAETAPGSAHALDLHDLQGAAVSFFSAWDGVSVLGVAALKHLDPVHGEVKSMHTAAAARRRGVGAALLAHLIAAARTAGLKRLSLETGSWPYFEPARSFYRRHGFRDCGPFAGYQPDPNSVFMTLEL